MASCKSCGASIEWVRFASGKANPFDVAPSPDGMFAVVNGIAHRYTDDDARLHRERRTSHFSTCPQANDWRTK